MPIMVFYDGTPESVMELAIDKGLTFPILSDPNKEVFGRWNPATATPKTTVIEREARVYEVDTHWHTDMLEELLYGPSEDEDW